MLTYIMVKFVEHLFLSSEITTRLLCQKNQFLKRGLATILTKKIMFWKLVNSFKMMK